MNEKRDAHQLKIKLTNRNFASKRLRKHIKRMNAYSDP